MRGSLAEGLQSARDLSPLLRAQHFGEAIHLALMRGKDLLDKAAAGGCEVNDADAAILRAVRARDQSALEQAVNCDGNRARRQENLGANRIYRHRALVQQRLQDAKLRITEAAVLECAFGESEQRVVGLDENQPELRAGNLVGFFSLSEPLLP